MTRLLIGLLIAAAAMLGLYWMYGSGVSNTADPTAQEARAPAATFSIPEVPNRPPIEASYWSYNIYAVVCKLGHPFMVQSFSLDPNIRHVYFVGPFITNLDDPNPTIHNYLYKQIPGINRTRGETTQFMDSVGFSPEDVRHDELAKFLIPRVQSIPDRLAAAKKILGKPAAVRELKSGRTRMVFAGHMCLGEQYLAGMYVDLKNGRIEKAKGIVHPERLKWMLSGGRPPPPDTEPTYYEDMYMRTPDAQARLLSFMRRREEGDKEGAAKLLAPDYFPFPELVEEITSDPHPEGKLEYDTATYQILRYSLDDLVIKATYQLDTGIHIETVYEMKQQGEEWRVSGLVSEDQILSPTTQPGAEDCDRREKLFYGAKYYKRCRCQEFTYEELERRLAGLGVRVVADTFTCNEFDGEEWCQCGIEAHWAEHPQNKAACERKKKRALAILEETDVGRNSSWLICWYD